jgi:hypothetical protein
MTHTVACRTPRQKPGHTMQSSCRRAFQQSAPMALSTLLAPEYNLGSSWYSLLFPDSPVWHTRQGAHAFLRMLQFSCVISCSESSGYLILSELCTGGPAAAAKPDFYRAHSAHIPAAVQGRPGVRSLGCTETRQALGAGAVCAGRHAMVSPLMLNRSHQGPCELKAGNCTCDEMASIA